MLNKCSLLKVIDVLFLGQIIARLRMRYVIVSSSLHLHSNFELSYGKNGQLESTEAKRLWCSKKNGEERPPCVRTGDVPPERREGQVGMRSSTTCKAVI